jgi:tRNA A58 N-methylase Trm61
MERFTLDKLPQVVLEKIDLETAFKISRLIIAAERFQVFRELHGNKLPANKIEKKLKIHKRYLTIFLDALVSTGLLVKKSDVYGNSALAEKYFIKERSIYWTRQFSKECVEAYEAFAELEKVLSSGEISHAIKRAKKKNYLKKMEEDREEAKNFTQMLFYYHHPDGEALAEYLNLRDKQAVLDVGGGSGVMSIPLVKKNPNLRACIMDIAPVCRIAEENINNAGLSHRISMIPGDFCKGLPEGFDVIMCCDIGRVPKELIREAYKRLISGGMIVLIDRYFSNDRTEPLDKLLNQFEGSEFGMETRGEIVELLKDCGFKNTNIDKLINDIWVITGRKIDQ